MSTTLTANYFYCFANEPCFGECMEYLIYTPAGNSTVNFGPYYSTITNGVIGCSCSQYSIVGAQVTNNYRASGSSSASDPFTLASLTGDSAAYLVRGAFTMGTGQYAGLTCNINYYLTSGPAILGVNYYYFGYWWAIFVACLVFFIICLGCAWFCGLCVMCFSSAPQGRYGGKTLNPPPAMAETVADYPISQPNGGATYQYETTPNGTYQPSAIPVAMAVPVDDNRTPIASAEERQVATV